MEKWIDIFNRKWASGRYWKDLMGETFSTRYFLEYEDALYIATKAEADGMQNVIDKFKGTPLEYVIPEIELMIEKHWENFNKND
jgi:hypothetical protein